MSYKKIKELIFFIKCNIHYFSKKDELKKILSFRDSLNIDSYLYGTYDIFRQIIIDNATYDFSAYYDFNWLEEQYKIHLIRNILE